MRKMLIVTGIAAVIAAPASAQSYSASYGTGNVINLPALEHGGDFAAGTPNSAYANAPEGAAARRLHNISAEALSRATPIPSTKPVNMLAAIRIRTCGSNSAAIGRTTKG